MQRLDFYIAVNNGNCSFWELLRHRSTLRPGGTNIRIVKLIMLCILAILVGVSVRYLVREHRAISAYDNARLGQTEAIVLERLGPPDQVLKCGEYLWWNG